MRGKGISRHSVWPFLALAPAGSSAALLYSHRALREEANNYLVFSQIPSQLIPQQQLLNKCFFVAHTGNQASIKQLTKVAEEHGQEDEPVSQPQESDDQV